MYASFKSFIVSVLGSYTPVVYNNGVSDIIPGGFAGVDWSYVIAGAILCIVIYSVFKLIGACICKMY